MRVDFIVFMLFHLTESFDLTFQCGLLIQTWMIYSLIALLLHIFYYYLFFSLTWILFLCCWAEPILPQGSFNFPTRFHLIFNALYYFVTSFSENNCDSLEIETQIVIFLWLLVLKLNKIAHAEIINIFAELNRA